MRKLKCIALALSATMLCGALTACGSNNGGADANANGDKVYKVGIIQQMEHVALDAATKGFRDLLTEKLGDKVTFDYQNAQGEAANCSTIATKFVTDGDDLIMANATTALQATATATNSIPIVGTSITDYKVAGVIKDPEKPGTNVTGASDLAPIDQQIALLKRICPDVKKVAILYCSAEPNSVYQAELAEKYLKENGMESTVYTAADSNEMQAVVNKAAEGNDAFYIPTDNTFANNMEIVKNITLSKKIPVFCGEEGMCSKGGLATLSISYEELGRVAGEMAYEILVNGANPAEMPIKYVTDGITPKYNKEVADQLGIKIPDDLTAIEQE